MRKIRLGQEFPTDTDPVLIYETPDNGTQPSVTSITITKVIDATANFSIYFNPGGTFDKTTALYHEVTAAADKRIIKDSYDKGLGMGNKGDQLWVKSHTAEAFNFMIFGEVDK